MMKLDRRRLLAAFAASAALSTLPARLAAQAAPAAAKTVDATDDYWGTTLTDPYRWMESGSDPDWRPWLEAQDAATRARLAAVPGRAALGGRVSALSGESVSTSELAPMADGSILYEQRPAGSQFFALYRRAADGAISTIIDPATMREGESHISIDWWDVSPDQRYLVYGLSPAGSEASVLHIMELATGTILPTRIPMTDFGAISWLPDMSGFFYHALTGARETPQLYLDSETRLHRLGSDPAGDTVVVKRGMFAGLPIAEGQFPIVSTITDTDFAIVGAYDSVPNIRLWTVKVSEWLAGTPRFTRVCTVEDGITDFAAAADSLWLVSEKGAPRRKLVSTRLSAPDLASAREVLPASEAVLESVYAVKQGAVAQYLDAGVQRLTMIDARGVHPLRLPFGGSTSMMHADAREDVAFVTVSDWLSPTKVIRIAPDGSATDTGLTPPPPIDVSPYMSELRFATARDGTRIPYSFLAKRGWQANGRNPVLVTAYGAYGSSNSPYFNARIIAFLEAGGIFVDAAVRGGGDYGREWHDAGKKATKPNTWRDMIDVCDALIAERVTAPAHLVGWGISAGGITIGRAMTERPELFAGAIAEVGFMNPIRYVAEQNIADIEEWGPMVDADSFRIMYAMDAYRAVLDNPAPARWPKVLVQTGINDPRAAPFHSAKFTAALQAKGCDAMLRVDFDAGHGMGSTRAQSDALRADEFAWTLAVAGGG